MPGHLRVPLEDRSKVWDLLAREFCSDDLDRVADKLWWMSKQDSGNISPLHRQLVKRRTHRDVSLRYAYGEIRLTRLNFYAPFLLGKSHFQRVEYQYGTYFARFYGPILFVIAVASVVLSGLQVIVSVGNGAGDRWPMGAALWISVTAIVTSYGLLFSLGLLLVYKVANEWKVAIRDRLRLVEERRATE
ncbi:hypothetical protein RB597_005709 [Gaeumannomyces tritici]